MESHLKDLLGIAPEKSNIRMLTLTEKQFNNIKIISGEISFVEKILVRKNLILDL
jgi:CRISPR/Cas system-associated protein endoribonuclease Cas2